MKHLFFLTLFLTGFAFNSSAQPPLYDDLLIYFADGNYEKLVDKSLKYMGGDDTKNDALPYMYASKGNYEMSKDQKYEEDFPKAWKDALKYAGKAVKKDKDGAMMSEHRAYFTTLKKAVLEEIQNMADASDYSRMRSSILKLQKLDPDDVGSHFLMATAQYRIKDKGAAKEALKTAQEKLDAIDSVDDWREVDLDMLRLGIIEYANFLADSRLCDKAKEIMNRVKQWFEEDDIFMSRYDEIVNGNCM